MSVAGLKKQFYKATQAAEMDGFQADTEEDEEDDDCMIVDVQPGKASTLTTPEPPSEPSTRPAALQASPVVSSPNPL